jgi:hypothetical protein
LLLHILIQNLASREEHNLAMIQHLINLCPNSAQVANEDGDLPLHILLKKTHEKLPPSALRILYATPPNALKHANNEGNLPLHCFFQQGIDEPKYVDWSHESLAHWEETLLNTIVQPHRELWCVRNLDGLLPLCMCEDNMYVMFPRVFREAVQSRPSLLVYRQYV